MEYILFLFIIVLIVVLLVNKKPAKKYQIKFNKPESQLDIVARSDFHKNKLMNKDEYGLFARLEPMLKSNHPGYRLFAQVSMGEFVGSTDRSAYGCVNSKRVDFVIISPYGEPVVVVEYQGSGHYQNDSIQRDAVKKEVCRKAGIVYVEIMPKYSSRDLDNVLLHIPARNTSI
ncbi:DUF2726 domain-containing protein [Kluyvera sichuanensis]|uniref:DUF2726 domain-containing protein n=1 Tax=Kluyvera sichuanensis TaxID=2725494 RepID=UPI0034A51EB8